MKKLFEGGFLFFIFHILFILCAVITAVAFVALLCLKFVTASPAIAFILTPFLYSLPAIIIAPLIFTIVLYPFFHLVKWVNHSSNKIVQMMYYFSIDRHKIISNKPFENTITILDTFEFRFNYDKSLWIFFFILIVILNTAFFFVCLEESSQNMYSIKGTAYENYKNMKAENRAKNDINKEIPRPNPNNKTSDTINLKPSPVTIKLGKSEIVKEIQKMEYMLEYNLIIQYVNKNKQKNLEPNDKDVLVKAKEMASTTISNITKGKRVNIPRLYRIKEGQTLRSIADIFGITIEDIEYINDSNLGSLIAGNLIRVRQTVQLGHHKIGDGETLDNIRIKYGMTSNELKKLNNISNDSYKLKIGTNLIVIKTPI